MKINTNEKVIVTNPDHPNHNEIYFFAFNCKPVLINNSLEDKIFVTRKPYVPNAPAIGLFLYPGEIDVLEKKETD